MRGMPLPALHGWGRPSYLLACHFARPAKRSALWARLEPSAPSGNPLWLLRIGGRMLARAQAATLAASGGSPISLSAFAIAACPAARLAGSTSLVPFQKIPACSVRFVPVNPVMVRQWCLAAGAWLARPSAPRAPCPPWGTLSLVLFWCWCSRSPTA